MNADAAAVVVAVIAVAAVAVNWWSRLGDRSRAETISKPLATVAIAVFALLHAGDSPTRAIVAGGVGFLCCLAGDVFLLDAVDRFVLGLTSFLVGHVAFIMMFVWLGLDRWALGGVALVLVSVLVGTIGQIIVSGAVRREPALRGPVMAYLLVISSMAVVGWATGRVAALVGSTAFVLSDSLLGWRAFVRPAGSDDRRLGLAVMVTYHLALVSLALSLHG